MFRWTVRVRRRAVRHTCADRGDQAGVSTDTSGLEGTFGHDENTLLPPALVVVENEYILHWVRHLSLLGPEPKHDRTLFRKKRRDR